MIAKKIHPARRVFRKMLLVLMGVSFVFLLFVVGLRIHYRNGHIEGPMQKALFKIDVVQHKARAAFGDDETDMIVINSLLQLSIFSTIYLDAGIEMLKEKAQSGYPPAVLRYEQIRDYLEKRSIQIR